MSKSSSKNSKNTDSSGDVAVGADNTSTARATRKASAAMPRARCTHCQTVFEISPEFLTTSDTRARCGECMSIFDVLSNLQYDDPEVNAVPDDQQKSSIEEDDNIRAPNPDSSPADTASISASDSSSVEPDLNGLVSGTEDVQDEDIISAEDTQALDVTYSDFDLFSADANLPEVAYFDQTQDPELLRYNEPDGEDETFSDTLFANDMTIEAPVSADNADDTLAITRDALETNVDFITDDVPHEPPAFVYRDRPLAEPAKESNTPESEVPDFLQDAGSDPRPDKRWGLKLGLGALVLLIAGGLYAFKERQAIYQNPELRPYLVKACDIVGCSVPAFVDLDAFKVLKRSVFSHPTVKNALVIDVAFVNESILSQPYPVLEVRLTDRNGGLVVQNNVEPFEYLETRLAEELRLPLMLPDERLDVSLTIEDPGQTATSFVLQFRQ